MTGCPHKGLLECVECESYKGLYESCPAGLPAGFSKADVKHHKKLKGIGDAKNLEEPEVLDKKLVKEKVQKDIVVVEPKNIEKDDSFKYSDKFDFDRHLHSVISRRKKKPDLSKLSTDDLAFLVGKSGNYTTITQQIDIKLGKIIIDVARYNKCNIGDVDNAIISFGNILFLDLSARSGIKKYVDLLAYMNDLCPVTVETALDFYETMGFDKGHKKTYNKIDNYESTKLDIMSDKLGVERAELVRVYTVLSLSFSPYIIKKFLWYRDSVARLNETKKVLQTLKSKKEFYKGLSFKVDTFILKEYTNSIGENNVHNHSGMDIERMRYVLNQSRKLKIITYKVPDNPKYFEVEEAIKNEKEKFEKIKKSMIHDLSEGYSEEKAEYYYSEIKKFNDDINSHAHITKSDKLIAELYIKLKELIEPKLDFSEDSEDDNKQKNSE